MQRGSIVQCNGRRRRFSAQALWPQARPRLVSEVWWLKLLRSPTSSDKSTAMLHRNSPRLACRWWCRPQSAIPLADRTASSLGSKQGPSRHPRTRAPRPSTKCFCHSTAVRRWPRRRLRATRRQVQKARRRPQRRPPQSLLRADRPLYGLRQPRGLVMAAQRHCVTESPTAAFAFAGILDRTR
jgi:hypothetical protein